MENKIARLKQGRRIAFISSIVSLLLAVMKGIIGYLFGSQVLIADAFHSGADLLTHAASGFGLWIASRRKTTKFPYGLYRAETLACLIVGGFIVVAGIEVLREGCHRLFYLDPVKSFPILPVAASIISSVAAFFIAKVELKVGKSIGSPSLIASSREAFLDIFTSLIVFIGILLAYFRIPYVEGAIMILISLLLFKLGIANTWTSLLVLMDANLDPELQYELEKKVNEICGVKGLSDVKIRQSGPFRMVECIIKTRPSLPLYRAHELANKVEELITKDYENIESVFIHVEPLKDEIVSAIIPVRDIKGMDSLISGHFGRAPYFVIVRMESGNVEIEDFCTNEFLNEKAHIGIKIVRAIIKYRIDLVFVSNIGEIAYYMLKDKLADVYRVEEGLSVKEVMQRYRLNQLELITEPTHAVEESQVINQFSG
ncbi:MAG TPA: cation diffusion facilitator family transporter [Syntrophales bacterium]|nr:cation diffusion facilitator family transporter [Syntrophales bacterium]